MYCRHCGKQIADISQFCQHCGKSVGMDVIKEERQTDFSANTETVINTGDSITHRQISPKNSNLKGKRWIFAGSGAIALFLVIVILFFGGNDNVTKDVESILEKDLNTSVKITTLYYNEEAQGCFVEFTTEGSFDAAAVHLDTGDIDYKSKFNYYSEKAERLRAQSPINETELHKCNQEILNSSYAEWNFTVAVMKADGTVESNGWKKVK